jgi:hypothetical protein
MPERINRFLPSFMSLNGIKRVDARVPDPDRPLQATEAESALRKRRVLIMGAAAADPEEEKSRRLKGIAQFRTALKEYLREDSIQFHAWSRGGGVSRDPRREARLATVMARVARAVDKRPKSMCRQAMATMATVGARAQAGARACVRVRTGAGRRTPPRSRARVSPLHPLHPRQEERKERLAGGEGAARLARAAHNNGEGRWRP